MQSSEITLQTKPLKNSKSMTKFVADIDHFIKNNFISINILQMLIS